MFRWLKQVFIYLVLSLYGRGRRDQFLTEVKRHCRKRCNRLHVPGITEELDELLDVPDNCIDDVSFVGFTKDGHTASFRVARADQEYGVLSMELPGIGRFSFSQSRHLGTENEPLKLQVLDPMRRWKISFSGRVNCYTYSGDTDNELLHASVSLFWQCTADPFDHVSCLTNWQLARNLSGLGLGSCMWKRVFSRESIQCEQWGDMWGRIEVEGHESLFMRLKGFRKRRIERIGCTVDETAVSHHLIEDKGCFYITNGILRQPNTCSDESFGYITVPVGERWVTHQFDLKLLTNTDNNRTLQYPVQTTANGKTFEIDKIYSKAIPLKLQSNAFSCSICFTKFTINGQSAYGVVSQDTVQPLNHTNKHQSVGEEKQVVEPPKSSKLTLALDESDCRHPSLVGGKAANLAFLRGLNHTVPNAFVVTAHALTVQFESQPHLRRVTQRIEDDFTKMTTAERTALCASVVESWMSSGLSPAIGSCVENELIRIFGNTFIGIPFAVRSSAVCEDGSETSFAGQMESYLGVKGLDNILLAIRKCWASSFTYQAVEYRRQNGQCLLDKMAVIIQEMVNADVAGVLFTSDPVTGNTSTMVINAAPGLGEIVVSGKCNPDTIRVRRQKGEDDFAVTATEVGTSDFKLVCASDTGVIQVVTNDRNRKEPCISVDQIKELCRIGTRVEKSKGSPQDIEWAISNGRVFLLQTRPITSLNEETEEELLHEFDSALATDFECLTTNHIGEVMPGCITTLSQDRIINVSSRATAEFTGINSGATFSKYADKAQANFTNRQFLGVTAVSVPADCFMQDKEAFEISVLGQVLEEHTLDMIQSYKGGPVSTVKSLKAFVNGNFIQAPKYIERFAKWEKSLEFFTIETDNANAEELYKSIDENVHVIFQTLMAYLFALSRSFIPFGIMFKMLRGKKTTTTTEMSADIAVLLSNCPKVFSADVPRSMQRLASAIAASDLKDKFLLAQDSDCHYLLMNADISVRIKYQEFLDMHGHRSIKEMDLIEKSWKADPSTLMRTLKMMIKSPQNETQLDRETKSNAEILAMLKTELSWFQKFIIRTIILDRAKAGVAAREKGKSVTVKTVSLFKHAYWRLAQLMVKEARLPEERMLFFLTHIEIGTLLETRSAALVRKARRRMQVVRLQEVIRYPRINYGPPVAVSEDNESLPVQASLTVTGMPIGKGVATGRACVVLTLSDADSIETGDILICPFTDIGWSPYFPMLAGLVTEVGGLISHGAVVAREVGIPCIVNAVDATRLIKTGDKVKIDGLAGMVQRLVD